jgi:membrane-bound metal-dependent hydrolase YbcI (DUF457 family)
MLNVARPFLGWAWLAIVVSIMLFAASRFIGSVVEHRGPTHSFTVGAALSLIVCLGFAIAGQTWTLGLWFGWGYLSHLLADGITQMGCPAILWPWQGVDFGTWRIRRAYPSAMVRPSIQVRKASLESQPDLESTDTTIPDLVSQPTLSDSGAR